MALPSSNKPPLRIEERASLREADKIPFKEFSELVNEYFPLGRKLGSGTYGTVFLSVGEDFAVKKFNHDPKLTELTRELNFYASNLHPCIMRPVCWTGYGGFGYLVMPIGKDITEANILGDIGLDKILFDLLSAITFLNRRGIAHADIKVGNVVYYKDKCMLIDFGFARFGEFDADGQCYIKGVAYTVEYRDPEYYYDQYNNIKVELCSIANVCLAVKDRNYGKYGQLYAYERKVPDEIKWYIDEAKKLIKDRPTATALLETAYHKYSFDFQIGTILDGTMVNPIRDRRFKILAKWLIQIAYLKDLKVETVFVGLNLIYRTWAEITAQYPLDQVNKMLQPFGSVCMFLAIMVDKNEESFEKDVKENVTTIQYWKNTSDLNEDPHYDSNFEEMIVKVLRAAGGIVSTLTNWHYAKSGEDLIPLLHDVVYGKYNLSVIRQVQEGSNKCIRMKELGPWKKIEAYFSKEREVDKYQPPEERRVNFCQLDLTENAKFVELWWRGASVAWDRESTAELIGVLMHNRHTLKTLPKETYTLIFNTLYENRHTPYIAYILDLVCAGFDWRGKPYYVKDKDMNPFQL